MLAQYEVNMLVKKAILAFHCAVLRLISTANKALGFSHTIVDREGHKSMIKRALVKLKLNTHDFKVTLLRFP